MKRAPRLLPPRAAAAPTGSRFEIVLRGANAATRARTRVRARARDKTRRDETRRDETRRDETRREVEVDVDVFAAAAAPRARVCRRSAASRCVWNSSLLPPLRGW